MSTKALSLLEVDPRTLQVIDQVRDDATPDDALIASVRERGIIEPPTVAHAGDGNLVIVTGHRRVGAAIAAGLKAITVVVRSDANEADRLADQIVENERRKQLNPTEVAAGYQQLELFGRTPDDIAAALGDTPDRVRAGLKVARTTKLPTVLEQHPQIDLQRAAELAEFDDDKTALAKLTEIATTRPEYFADHLRRQRAKRVNSELAEKLRDQLEADGVTVIKAGNSAGAWWRGKDDKGGALERLTTPAGNAIAPSKHKKCPGHAAIVEHGGEWGESKIVYVCTDVEGNGHSRGTTSYRLTPEEEKARQERDEANARKEANAAARRAWIREHLATGRLRPTAQHFEAIAEALSATARSGPDANPLAVELLTGETPTNWSTAAARITTMVEKRETPAFRVIIAHALAVLEHPWVGDLLHCRHIERLAEWGYPLTEIDQATLDDNTTRIAAAAAEENAA